MLHAHSKQSTHAHQDEITTTRHHYPHPDVPRLQGFTRFVQNGRVCLINYGPDEGKLVTIVDVIDQNRCVVYGPTSGVPRQVLGYKRLSLTDIKINIGRGTKAKTADAAWSSEDVEGQWAKTSWAKKLAA